MVDRVPDWRAALNALVEDRRHTPHEWGTHDCGLWFADAHLAITGVDEAAKARGKYKTALGAAKTMRCVWGVDRMELIAEKLYGPRLPISFARAGDPVLADLALLGLQDPDEGGLGLAVGVCLGSTTALTGAEGLVFLPTLSLVGTHHG